jgi:hypothetical protein
MTTTTKRTNWAGIESESMDSANWVQVAYRATVEGEFERHYKVFGEIQNEGFAEDFMGEDSKELAYDFYWEKLSIIELGSVYCVDCGEFATTQECANAVSQTGGYCLDCAPEQDDEEATRWL